MLVEDKDLEIVGDESIQGEVARQGLRNSQLSVVLGAIIIGLYALLEAIVMAVAFIRGQEPPTWATAIESSTITGALAVIFKNHLPGGNAAVRQQGTKQVPSS